MRPEELTLCINAGGRGLRLGGVPKGLIELEGRTVIERLLDLQPFVSGVLLVANDPVAYGRFGLRTVADVVPDRGAPGGVVTALLSCPTPWALVVACDMPWIEPAALQPLFDAASAGVDAVVYEREGRLEGLLGLYRRTLGEPWRQRLEQGAPSLQALLRSAALAALRPALDRWFQDLDTPADLGR